MDIVQGNDLGQRVRVMLLQKRLQVRIACRDRLEQQWCLVRRFDGALPAVERFDRRADLYTGRQSRFDNLSSQRPGLLAVRQGGDHNQQGFGHEA